MGKVVFMRVVEWLKKSPLWLLLPAVAVAGAAWAAVMGYEPLVFDPSLYETEQAHADELVKTVEPDESAKEGTPAEDVEVEAAPAVGALADGTWTGYAACGTGNPDGWKPYYVAVSITVSGGKVTGLNSIAGASTAEGKAALNWDAAENQSYLDKAVSGVRPQISATLPAASAPSGVDTVSGATYSSAAIYNAYVDALAKSAAAAGATAPPAEAVQPDSGDESKKAESIAVDDEVGTLADGTWTGYAECGEGNEDGWKEYYVGVTVEVADGAVKKVADVFGSSTGDAGARKLDWDKAENQTYLDWAIGGRTRSGKLLKGVVTQMEERIARGEQPSSVDVVSGATYSSKAIFSAFYAALAKSAAEGGAVIDEPDDDAVHDDAGEDPDDDEPGEGLDLSGEFADGTHRGFALCSDLDTPSAYKPYYIIVEITVEAGKVVAVSDVHGDASGEAVEIADEFGEDADSSYEYDAHENASYLNKAINGSGLFTKGVVARIQAKLDAGEEVSGIDTISGATWSSKAIIEAFAQAVEHARA